MRKFYRIIVVGFLAFSSSLQAQLPWNTALTKDYVNNSQVLISSTGSAEWTTLGGLQLKADQSDAVIALPNTGLAQEVTFKYRGGVPVSAQGTFTLSIYESTDHNNWSLVWTTSTYNLTNQSASANLRNTTRYLKLEYTATSSTSLVDLVGATSGTFVDLTVSEQKDLSAGIDEYTFPQRMVDDAVDTKSVNVYWTNVAASVTSSDSHFLVSTATIGQKAQAGQEAQAIGQTSALIITYTHSEAGVHTGTITISDGDRSATIQVSGETRKYDQELYWNQSFEPSYLTTDQVYLTAYTNRNLPVVYASSDASVATVDSTARVIVHRYGQVTITATQPGNYKYNAAASISKQLVFTRAIPEVSVSVDNLVYGQPLSEATLHENTGHVPGTLAFKGISLDSVLGAGTYDLQVEFMPQDTFVYEPVLRMVSLTVDKASQTITWNQAVTTLAIGDTLMMGAASSSMLPLTYAKTGNQVDIEGNQLLGRDEGDVLIVAFQQGNENYLPSTVMMQSFVVAGGVRPEPIHDTVLLHDTIYIPDTVLLHDTIYIPDTILLHDTLYITDTIFFTDTVYLYDTVYIDPISTQVSPEPLAEPDESRVVKYIRNGQVYIRHNDRIYGIAGKRIE